MNVESFASGNSLLHRRDARVKLIAAFVLSLILALNSDVTVAIAGCIICGILLILSKPNSRLFLKRMVLVNTFTLFLFITLPLTYGSDPSSGFAIATIITLKTNAIFCCFLALIATSSAANLGYALETLGLPTKLTFLFLFSYRQLFIINQEYERLKRAARLRGFTPHNNLHTYRTYSYLFAMTLVKSWNRADRVHQAMLLRGFSGKLIPLRRQSPGKDDYLFLSVLLLIALLLTLSSLFSPVSGTMLP
jgi:cobalt/nickel transport system permease protein